eukprot:CAMPEP_0180302842 /NCGR_PEP_ID=MMETSP0988-20121125/24571_1 /TAXON_ID=697907 /ORGANISM="non described non described, Strain CCMP2293" /LENGTH=69 /DNA_ID=CAMNT_0022284161 /DNA_START=45 /DNA_END=251 /DNA_ORIENTATION=+
MPLGEAGQTEGVTRGVMRKWGARCRDVLMSHADASSLRTSWEEAGRELSPSTHPSIPADTGAANKRDGY